MYPCIVARQRLGTHVPAATRESHVTTDGQSVTPSWCRAPSGAHDQILITVWPNTQATIELLDRRFQCGPCRISHRVKYGHGSRDPVAHHPNAFTFTLLLSEGRAGEVWEPYKKRCPLSLPTAKRHSLLPELSLSSTLLLYHLHLSLHYRTSGTPSCIYPNISTFTLFLSEGWVTRDLEPSITVLARTSSNLAVSQSAPTQEDKPLLSSKRRPHFQTLEQSWNEHKLGRGSDRTRNQERLCLRGSAAIYWTELD
jgi:hypothetical protein